MSKVIIRIKPGGKTEVKAVGIPGGDCRLATKPYLDALAGKVVSDKPTADAQLPTVGEGVREQVSQ